MPQVFASADVGSNTVHLLVAEVVNGTVRRLHNESDWLSLGEAVVRYGSIPDHLVRRLISTLRRYRQTAGAHHAQVMYVFGTEALRSAANRDEVVQRIESESGLSVDVIEGRVEALYSLSGALLDSDGPSPFLLVEVGGGSVQVARCHGDEIIEQVSLPLGTGRLIATAALTQPAEPDQLAALDVAIQGGTECLFDKGKAVRCIASGGVARGLWRSLHPDGDRVIHLFELDYLSRACSGLEVERIVQRFSVKENRARTLVPGAWVYGSLLRAFKLEAMTVSQCGVREGALLEMSARGLKECRV